MVIYKAWQGQYQSFEHLISRAVFTLQRDLFCFAFLAYKTD